MARQATPLNDTKIKSLQYDGTNKKYFDGGGLYLFVTIKSKIWRLKYNIDKKEKVYVIGFYPEVSLKEAREAREELKIQIKKGIDPNSSKKEEKIEEKIISQEDVHTFEYIAANYLDSRSELDEKYLSGIVSIFKRDVYPLIGKKAINKIMAKDIIEIIKQVEARQAITSAHRLFTQLNKVFKHAVAHQYALRNPCSDIDKNEILSKPKQGHFATITNPKEIGMLLNVIDDYSGDFTTRMALTIMPYVFLRPFNIRHAEWSEIDFDDKIWRIPASKMKTSSDHLVPLTARTIEILKEVQRFTYDSKYIFPSTRSKTSPMSDNTLNNALRRMGYTKEEITSHGFRAMFSTIAHEEGKAHEAIETQLAHSVGNKVSQAYNRALYLKERKELMQWWSDYLDEVKRKANEKNS